MRSQGFPKRGPGEKERQRKGREKAKTNTHVAPAGQLDQPKLLHDFVCPELLPPAAHQGLRRDLVLDQALRPQADETVLAERGVRVRVPHSLQGRQSSSDGTDAGPAPRERNPVPGTSTLPSKYAGSISPGLVSRAPATAAESVGVRALTIGKPHGLGCGQPRETPLRQAY